MARFGSRKNRKSISKRTLHKRVKGKKNAKIRRPVLSSRRGVNQSSYEAGFFDFLRVFLDKYQRMNILDITKQAAKTWDVLLPRPKLSKKRVFQDYREEWENLQREKMAEKERLTVQKKSSVRNKEKSNEDNESDFRSDRSRSSMKSFFSAKDSLCSGSATESEPERKKIKSKKGKKDNTAKKSNSEQETQNKPESNINQPGSSTANDGILFPVRRRNSFDRLVEADLNNQTELLRKLRIGKPCRPRRPCKPYDSNESNSSDGSDSNPDNSNTPQNSSLVAPTNILHVKNLKIHVTQSDLRELFNDFLKDIVQFDMLDTKFRGEAVVEFNTIESAQNAWRQLNDINFRGLPVILEFTQKEDILRNV